MYENITSQTTTVFLVDDDDLDVKAVVRGFKKHNISNPIIRARDGLEAWEMLNVPDKIPAPFIILLDINMPRMDGLSLLKKIRTDRLLNQVKVFILTTSDSDQDRLEAHNLNVEGYCLKKNSGKDCLHVVKMLENYW